MIKKIKASHGTIWEGLIPEEPYITQAAFFHLNVDKNDLKVFFLSENESVCDSFSSMKFYDEENQLQVMIVGEVSLDSEFTVTRKYEFGKKVEYEGEFYDYSCNDEREVLYSKLRDNGMKSFIMENDYDTSCGGGSDIAVIDKSIFESQMVKIKNNNGSWSKEMRYEEAKSLLVKFMSKDMKNNYDDKYEESHINDYEEEISFDSFSF